MAILRGILGVLAGVVAAGILVALLEFAGHVVFPPPAAMDPTNLDSIREHLPKLHPGAFVSILLAWAAGVFVGAWLSAWIAGRAPFLHAGLVGMILLVFCAANLVMIPHPLWFMAAALAAVPLATAAGAWLAQRPPRQACEPAVAEN